MKCAVKDCQNHANEGKFIGLLCAPCHTFIAGDGGLHSQAYRNSRSMIDAAIAMEREACAVACEEHPDGLNMLGGAYVTCAAAIRARGNT